MMNFTIINNIMRCNFNPCNVFFFPFFLYETLIKVLIDCTRWSGTIWHCMSDTFITCMSTDGRGDVDNTKIPNGALHYYYRIF
jgi:hypothetical protein